MQQVLCIHSGNTNCVMFLLKKLSLSFLVVIQGLILIGFLLETRFGYVLTMGNNCFIILCPYVTEELWKRLPSSRVQTNKGALGALILTVPFPANVGLALHEFYIKNFPYRAPKTLHVHQYLEGVSGVAT